MLTLNSDPAGVIAALEARISRGIDVAWNKHIIRDFRFLNPEPM